MSPHVEEFQNFNTNDVEKFEILPNLDEFKISQMSDVKKSKIYPVFFVKSVLWQFQLFSAKSVLPWFFHFCCLTQPVKAISCQKSLWMEKFRSCEGVQTQPEMGSKHWVYHEKSFQQAWDATKAEDSGLEHTLPGQNFHHPNKKCFRIWCGDLALNDHKRELQNHTEGAEISTCNNSWPNL